MGSENKTLTNGGRYTITSGRLSIASATWLDSGVYTCKANNSLGTAESLTHVAVFSKSELDN